MTALRGCHRFAWRARSVIFSLLVVLAVLVTPLLTALPVYADWGADTRLTSAAGNSKEPSIAVWGNNVHVVWLDSRDGNDEIYYKRSTDGGSTWGADIRLTDNLSASENPSIAVSGNNVHIAWYDNRDGNPEIYYKRSTDSGVSWGADTRLTNAAGNSFTPSIAVFGSNVHVAWHDSRDGNEEIYYKRSTDSGVTWGADTRLTNAAGNSALTSIAVSGNNVHVAWQDERDGNREIYYERSADGGISWGVDTRLTNAPGDSRYPSIAVSGNNVYVAWQDIRSGNFQVYFKRSTDSGVTWGADTRLVNSPDLSQFPCIAVYGNNVHVAWQDNRGQYYPRWDIFYKRSTDGGNTWGADTRLTSAPDNSEIPVIAVACGYVHVAWQDFRDGNYEIYYKKYTPIPTIISFSPASGGPGTSVVITGTDFTCADAVSFGGTAAASFTVDSDTQITATVGGGVTGKITVTILSGTGISSDDFNFIILTGNTPHGSSVTGTGTTNVQQGPVPMSSISVSSASLSAARVAPGAPVIVTADVVNTGTANGTSRIKVYVNGEEENSQGVAVNRGGNTPVTFNVSRNEPGTYTVYVGGTNAGSFTVEQFADSNMVLYISGALILFAFAIGVIYITRRRQPGR